MASFASVEQRMVHTYIDTMPPLMGDAVGEEEAVAFHGFISALYQLLFAQPELLFPSLHTDGCFRARFNKASEKMPELQNTMRADMKLIDTLLQTLIDMMNAGELCGTALRVPGSVKISARAKAILAALNVPSYKEGGELCFALPGEALAKGWKSMAALGAQEPERFTCALFAPDVPGLDAIYARLLGDEAAYRRLTETLLRSGCTRSLGGYSRMSLDYAKDHGKKPTPLKAPFAEREHSGISLQYDPFMEQPAFLTLRIPSWKLLIPRLNEMPMENRRAVLAVAQHCHGCRYCVQTDKTGKAPLKALPVALDGGTVMLCPNFPGYSFVLTSLDMPAVEQILAFLAWIDEQMPAL